jgi:hypothetical protein
MLELSEYLKLIKEEDAPGLGAPAGGPPPAAGGAPPDLGAPPAGGPPPAGLGGLSAPSAGGAPPDLGAPPTGAADAGGAKTADIDLKDAFYYLKKYFG